MTNSCPSLAASRISWRTARSSLRDRRGRERRRTRRGIARLIQLRCERPRDRGVRLARLIEVDGFEQPLDRLSDRAHHQSRDGRGRALVFRTRRIRFPFRAPAARLHFLCAGPLYPSRSSV